MMQQTSPLAAERRRAQFAGSLRLGASDHDGSYQQLRAELGEENTNRLITSIGTLAMSSGIASSGVSLSDAVKRIIGSLTPGERSAIASGAAPPPRVQALLDSEVKAAQQQRQTQLAAATVTAEDGLLGQRHGGIPTAFQAMRAQMAERAGRSGDYNSLYTGSNWSSEAGMAQMREFAREQGMPWAANNPGLLRLGPSAIQTLAAMQVDQRSYNRVTREAGVTDRAAVAIADSIRRRGGTDARPAYNATADLVTQAPNAQGSAPTPLEQAERGRIISDFAISRDDASVPAEVRKRHADRHQQMLDGIKRAPGGDRYVEPYERALRLTEQSTDARVRAEGATTSAESSAVSAETTAAPLASRNQDLLAQLRQGRPPEAPPAPNAPASPSPAAGPAATPPAANAPASQPAAAPAVTPPPTARPAPSRGP